MTFQLLETRFFVLPTRTRFPFRYGIASMSALPHLFVNVTLAVNGQEVKGLASEGLPPKWFTKDPVSLFEADLAEMLAVIQNASRLALNAGRQPGSYFQWWQELYSEQKRWATMREVPPLLANLGVSLMERAVLDGLCKAVGQSLHAIIKSNWLGIDLGRIHEELGSIRLEQVIADQPTETIFARHTVGLGDPLSAADVPAGEEMQDGLPHTLEESIRAYGLRYFKIKVGGNVESDLMRLREISRILVQGCPEGFYATLDGNEQFESLAAFREFYERLRAEPALAPLFQSLLLIEQPLHRRVALKDEVAEAITSWKGGPGLIIDEADGALTDLPKALDLGYCGTSHKNCKGIVKGLANAALLKKRAPQMAHAPILSGEDLANLGPVAMLQDLAMMGVLGVTHVERNGHHYFRGLSMFPEAVQAEVLRVHADLYHKAEAGFPTLKLEGGRLVVGSVNAAPFGCGITLDMEAFEPLNAWIKRGGMGEL